MNEKGVGAKDPVFDSSVETEATASSRAAKNKRVSLQVGCAARLGFDDSQETNKKIEEKRAATAQGYLKMAEVALGDQIKTSEENTPETALQPSYSRRERRALSQFELENADFEIGDNDNSLRAALIVAITNSLRDSSFVVDELNKRRRHERQEKFYEDPIKKLVERSKSYGLLTAEEEKKYFGKIDDGVSLVEKKSDSGRLKLNELDFSDAEKCTLFQTAAAHEIIYMTNIRLVMKIALHSRDTGLLQPSDLIGYSLSGLERAICLFDSSKGLKFSTYAKPWISQAVQRNIENYSKTIRIPVNTNEKWVRARKRIKELQTISDHELTLEERAKHVSMEPEELDELEKLCSPRIASLDKKMKQEDSTGVELYNLIPDESIPSADQIINDLVIRENFSKLFETASLDDRSKAVVGLRNNISPDFLPNLVVETGSGALKTYESLYYKIASEKMSREKIGQLLELNHWNVNSIERKALEALRKASKDIKH